MNIQSATLLVLSMVALAQPPVAVAEEEKETLGELVVTAQKREQRLIDVPMAITAMSGEDLEQRDIKSIQDLAFAVPGVATREDGPGAYTIFMRGVSNQYGTGAVVSVYLDEAPLSLTGYTQLDSRVMDLERVEVLKGPQGTLYGQGSLSGAVRYITRAPVLDAFGASLEASGAYIDDGDSKETLGGVVNLPVVKEVFGLRLAGTIERDGGWQDQPQAGIEDGNNQDLVNVRGKALWKATDALDVEAMVVVHQNESKLGLGYENPDRTITVAIDRSLVLIPKKFDYNLYNLNLIYEFAAAELLSASTYIDLDHEYPFSYIGGPQTIYGGDLEGNDARYVDATQFSQEIRLVSTGDGSFNWTVGGFYREAERDFLAYFNTLFAGTVFPTGTFTSRETYDSYSLFVDASYDVTDRLEIGAGARYFEDEQTNFDGTLTEEDKFDSVDPRVYATFALTDAVNLYANVAKGFRSGGFNRGVLPNYEPESLINYEIGAKGSLTDAGVDFELAVYYSDYDDMLRRGLVFIPDTGVFTSITSNLGKVEVKGVEGGVTWRATEALTLNATGAYIDSEITEVNATGATSLPGDEVDYVPEYSFTLGGHYAFNWTAEMPGYVRVDYANRYKVYYTDRTAFPPANVPQVSDDIGLLDARIGLDWGKTTFELFGTNLTNENKWIDPYHAWTNANRTRPRTVGLMVGFNFD